jgi:hypothetical protein
MIPSLIAGDDWALHFTVLNPDGSPFDLSGAPTILWTLLDKNSKHAVQAGDYTVAVLNASQGVCSVSVHANVTTRFSGNLNFYTHALRIVSGGITATPFTGQMNIISDPWAVTSAVQIVKFETNLQSKLDAGSPLRLAT